MGKSTCIRMDVMAVRLGPTLCCCRYCRAAAALCCREGALDDSGFADEMWADLRQQATRLTGRPDGALADALALRSAGARSGVLA